MDEPCQLDRAKLVLVKHIGKGGFGNVSLYNYLTTEDGVEVEKPVAVKTLLDGRVSEKDLKNLKQEAKLLWNLDCEHIISMVGLLCTGSEFCVVMEYASNGSCFDFFRHLRGFAHTKEQRRNVWPLKCRIAKEVIEGMKFLHGRRPKKIIHCDLKSANVLLDENLHAKICDFGLAQMHSLTALLYASHCTHPDLENLNGGKGGTLSHIAPELLKDLSREPTIKSDVYSYGVFLWELQTDLVPYKNVERAPEVLKRLRMTNNVLPSAEIIPADSPECLRKMMAQCLVQDPEQRPTIFELEEQHRGDFEPILPHADRSAQIVLDRKHPSMTTSTTLNSWHLEISTDSTDQQRIQNPLRSDHCDSPQQLPLGQIQPDKALSNSMSATASPQCSAGVVQSFLSDKLPPNTVGSSDFETMSQPLNGSCSHIAESGQHAYQDVSIDSGVVLTVPSIVSRKPGCPKNKTCYLSILVVVLLLSVTSTIVVLLLVPSKELSHDESTSQPQERFSLVNDESVCEVSLVIGGKVICNGIQQKKIKSGTTCNIECDVGYQLIGSPEITCLSEGHWFSSGTACKRVCYAEESISEYLEEVNCTNGNLENSLCTYRCTGGRNPTGSTVRTCQSDGHWSAPMPTCKCPHCKSGPTCEKSLYFGGYDTKLDSLWAKVALLTADNSPIQVTYDGHLITCESDRDLPFFDYDCTCRDTQHHKYSGECNNYGSRRAACRFSLASLLRKLVSAGLYDEPCDYGTVPLTC